jgi:FKBP-type peptidyl-prolyl cis-trans isomerase 2
MTVTTGQGNLIAGFENALTGMTAGENKTFTIEASDAYGDHNPDAFTELDRTVFPDDFEFEVGMTVPLMGPNGQVMAKLTEVADTTVTADLNHPLAGQNLTFEIEVITVEEPS